AASTLAETRRLIKETIEFHIEGMRITGDPMPEPTPYVEQIEVSMEVQLPSQYRSAVLVLKFLLDL
ncbi:MAG TPA: hypothetical protein VK708_04150, partial [Bryobacteraceae bacterium]|nr:hypothetical protein [Bryobacteraceae bacterium]